MGGLIQQIQTALQQVLKKEGDAHLRSCANGISKMVWTLTCSSQRL